MAGQVLLQLQGKLEARDRAHQDEKEMSDATKLIGMRMLLFEIADSEPNRNGDRLPTGSGAAGKRLFVTKAERSPSFNLGPQNPFHMWV